MVELVGPRRLTPDEIAAAVSLIHQTRHITHDGFRRCNCSPATKLQAQSENGPVALLPAHKDRVHAYCDVAARLAGQ